jgi:hypothetical protein
MTLKDFTWNDICYSEFINISIFKILINSERCVIHVESFTSLDSPFHRGEDGVCKKSSFILSLEQIYISIFKILINSERDVVHVESFTSLDSPFYRGEDGICKKSSFSLNLEKIYFNLWNID